MRETVLVIVPTRGRLANCQRLLDSFYETRSGENSDIVFLTDPDDQETYEDFDHKDAFYGVLEPRGTLSEKLNRAADAYAEYYDALFYVADDHAFQTPGWDRIMLGKLNAMGGSGMIYPDAKRRSDVPEIIMISSDIIQALGHFAEPMMSMYCLDNAWAELGKRSGLIRYCPEVVIPHLHYSITPDVERDATYAEAEEKHGEEDQEIYPRWQAELMQPQAAMLRREFNKDVHWLFSRVPERV